MVHLDTLPPPLLLEILQWCDVTDLCTLSGVSRFWRGLAADEGLWYDQCRGGFPGLTLDNPPNPHLGSRQLYIYLRCYVRLMEGYWAESNSSRVWKLSLLNEGVKGEILGFRSDRFGSLPRVDSVSQFTIPWLPANRRFGGVELADCSSSHNLVTLDQSHISITKLKDCLCEVTVLGKLCLLTPPRPPEHHILPAGLFVATYGLDPPRVVNVTYKKRKLVKVALVGRGWTDEECVKTIDLSASLNLNITTSELDNFSGGVIKPLCRQPKGFFKCKQGNSSVTEKGICLIMSDNTFIVYDLPRLNYHLYSRIGSF